MQNLKCAGGLQTDRYHTILLAFGHSRISEAPANKIASVCSIP